jgi:hypothetical protein
MPRPAIRSWPQALTDWCVIRAFEGAGWPGCLRRPPPLAAAFVSEVSMAVRFRLFFVRPAELAAQFQAAAESACEQAGGDSYRATRESAAAAENEYLCSITRAGHCPERRACHEQCAVALAGQRRQFHAEVSAAQRRCARAYWADQRGQWLRSEPFAHLRENHPVRQIATFAPVWWELFLHHLHAEFSRRDMAQFHLLDELPQLRRQVRPRKVLAAVVEDWREAHADELGLPAQIHYHVVARRGLDRAREAADWFNARAPGYTSDFQVADAARAHLVDHAATLPTANWSGIEPGESAQGAGQS